MEIKMKQYSLKLPSSSIVNLKSMLEILKIISKTGKVFTDMDIVKNNSPVNEKNLFRVLAYLKYLGFLYEKRERESINGKEQSVQRWYEEDKKEVSEFFFLLRDNREEESKKIFIEIIKKNDIYLSIKEELVKDKPSTTLIELKDYFRKKIPNKSPNYYNNGIKFVIGLLRYCGLITQEGNIIKLVETDKKETYVGHNREKKEKEDTEDKNDINLGDNKYFISIIGKNTKHEFPINETSDIEDVEMILKIIGKKL